MLLMIIAIGLLIYCNVQLASHFWISGGRTDLIDLSGGNKVSRSVQSSTLMFPNHIPTYDQLTKDTVTFTQNTHVRLILCRYFTIPIGRGK